MKASLRGSLNVHGSYRQDTSFIDACKPFFTITHNDMYIGALCSPRLVEYMPRDSVKSGLLIKSVMNPNSQVQTLSSADERCWVNWKFEKREGKVTKVPYMPKGIRASSTSSATWSTYAEVTEAAERFDGIGIVFTGSLLGVDIDHCISNDGSVSPEIASFVEKANTYTEVSPSGTGLHLYLRLTGPLELDRNRSGSYECYTSGRFFTVTGTPWTVSHPIRTIDPDAATELLRELGYPWKQEEVVTSSIPANTTLENDEVLQCMFAAKNGAKIQALYEGDTSEYDRDESRADAALCAHLAFWTGGNASQIEALWLASPLGARAKTQKRADYRSRTIENAIASTKETYSGPSQAPAIEARSTAGSKAIVTSFSDIRPQPVSWLWKDRIALGKVTLIVGDPGLGKSLSTVDIAAKVSTGSVWPVDAVPAPLGDVVFISAEDDPADTIRPRLDAAGADPSRVHVLRSIQKTTYDGKKTQRMFSLVEDIEALAGVLSGLPAPKLVIIDPISAYLGKADSHKNSDIRGLLAPLAEVATRFKVAVVAVSHLNKNSMDKNALYRTMGSLAFTAAARACFAVVRDREKSDRRLVLPVKNNLAQDLTGLAYSVMATEDNVPFIVWEQEAVVIPRDEILSPSSSQDERTDTDYAEMVLEIELREGPKPASEVLKAAKSAGVKDKALRRARGKLGVIVKKASFKGGWVWELPERQGAQEVQDAPRHE